MSSSCTKRSVILRKNDYISTMIKSAGFVIVDFSAREPLALCLLDTFSQWDFPKGHLEEGETPLTAAFRETEEECGLTRVDFIPAGRSVSTMPYKVPAGQKVATYFFAERISHTVPILSVNPKLGRPEHSDFRWIPIKSLYSIMSRRLYPVLTELEEWCENA